MDIITPIDSAQKMESNGIIFFPKIVVSQLYSIMFRRPFSVPIKFQAAYAILMGKAS